MTPSPSPLAPEFRGKTLTPISPLPLHVPEPSNIPVLQKQMDPVFNTTAVHLEPQQPSATDQVLLDRDGGSSDDATDSTASSVTDEGQTIGGSSTKLSTNGLEISQPVDDLTSTDPFEGKDIGNSMAYSSIQAAIDPNSEPQGLNSPESIRPGKSANDDLHSVLVESVENGENAASHISQPFQDTSPSAPLMTSPSTGVSTTQDNVQPSNTNVSEEISIPSSQVNYQALLANLIQPSVSPFPTTNSNLPAQQADELPSNETNLSNTSPSGGIPVNATLPPRPPPPERTADDTSQDDPRSLHLQIAGNPAINASNIPSAQSFRVPPALPAPVIAAGAPGTASAASGLPPPPGATFQQPSQQISPASSIQQRIDAIDRSASLNRDQDEAPWGPETQRLYDQFLQDERVYVAEAQWEKFPADSRLFVGKIRRSISRISSLINRAGNLATESVTKRDLFHVFSKYGKLAQISIKQAYGFVQFFESQPCRRALYSEQDSEIRGKRIRKFSVDNAIETKLIAFSDLELSKPQRSGGRRRSRSPDRGGNRDGNRGRPSGGRDRGGRGRDDYRPGRSPSPHSYGRRGDNYRGSGDLDRGRFDTRKRSRSRSPYGRSTRMRDRSPSPRHRDFDEDNSLLPRRAPGDVPEVQLIVLDDLDR